LPYEKARRFRDILKRSPAAAQPRCPLPAGFRLPGTHNLVIEVAGMKNASAQSAWIWVDAFDYPP
jgi:hypothetical protein